jgi:shikimate kinase / 3-dehydroquinate synthase
LIGFMGAGKSTIGAELAERLGRRFVEVDREIEEDTGISVPQLFEQHGEPAFRAVETQRTLSALCGGPPAVISLGGGAVTSADVRAALREQAVTVHLEIGVDEAWERVRGGDRPLAQDELRFRALYTKRAPLYAECADARATDVDGAVLAAGAIEVESGALESLGGVVRRTVALVTEPHVAGIHGAAAQLALGGRLASTHELPTGEQAKAVAAVERIWRALELDRDGVIVALGGGTVTDAAGFAAATYLRGIDWIAVPTTLVGQVDAAIGGKTAVDLPTGKNLVGAFHWPLLTVIDPVLLETLPAAERREGMAEVVKTGLLAAEPYWERSDPELVRGCAAYKTAVCLRDPFERGERAQLNLGHTFAHALEAAAGYDGVSHGQAVALGLLAALRLSGLDASVVEDVLEPAPVRVDRERAWAALQRDKKRADGELRLVLLEAPGRPRTGVTLPDRDVRAALDALIAG